MSFNAAVTISDESSAGTLEVQGGEVKVWAGGGTESNHYKIEPKGDTTEDYPYRNIQITNKNRAYKLH